MSAQAGLAEQVLSDAAFGERYALGALLGEGGMGAVYRGEQRALGRPVAIKFLAANFLRDEEYRERFVREARLAAGLIHSNVVAVFDFGVAAGIPYLVTELVDGESLGALLARVPTPEPATTFHVMRAVLDGLEAIHRLSIVHRDLKPANVLVGRAPPPIVKIADFGIAKQTIGGPGGLTAVGVLMGSPAYLAQEQITGDPVTPATDLYALTIVLWKMIVGQHPFPAGSAAQMLLMQRNTIPEVPPGLLPSVRQLLARGLVKDPEHRYRAAAELRAALAAVEADVQRAGGSWQGAAAPPVETTGSQAETLVVETERPPPATQQLAPPPPVPDPPLRIPTSPPVFSLPPPLPLKKPKPVDDEIIDLPEPEPPPRRGAAGWLVPLAVLWGLFLLRGQPPEPAPSPRPSPVKSRPASAVPSPSPKPTPKPTPAPSIPALPLPKVREELAAVEQAAAGRRPTDAIARLVALLAKLPDLPKLTPAQVARDPVAPDVDRAFLMIFDNALSMMPAGAPPPPEDAATARSAEPFITALSLHVARNELAKARDLVAKFRAPGADGARFHRASALHFLENLLAMRVATTELDLIHAMRELEVVAHAHPDSPIGAWAGALVGEVMAAAQLARAPARLPSAGWPFVEGGISDVKQHLRTAWFDPKKPKLGVGALRRAIIVSECVLTANDRAWRDSGAVPTSITREQLQQRLKAEKRTLPAALAQQLKSARIQRISLVQPMPPAAVLLFARTLGIKPALAASLEE